MADHWDFLLKKILRESPQQFVSWILKGAILSEILSVEFKRKSIYADALFRVVFCGQPILLHLEIQSSKHHLSLDLNGHCKSLHDRVITLKTAPVLLEGTKLWHFLMLLSEQTANVFYLDIPPGLSVPG